MTSNLRPRRVLLLVAAALLVMSATALPAAADHDSDNVWAGPIPGYVYDADTGEPVEGVTVEIRAIPSGPADEVLASVVTDATGYFESDYIEFDEISIYVRGADVDYEDGWFDPSNNFDVDNGCANTHDSVVPTRDEACVTSWGHINGEATIWVDRVEPSPFEGPVHGSVSDSRTDRPVAGATVEVHTVNGPDGHLVTTTTTDRDGNFETRSVGPEDGIIDELTIYVRGADVGYEDGWLDPGVAWAIEQDDLPEDFCDGRELTAQDSVVPTLDEACVTSTDVIQHNEVLLDRLTGRDRARARARGGPFGG